ncbi:deoxyribodipyrimidine photo-lyase [Curvibacter sp. APW13]|uniref:cryptochrome/photolyase family protein n=1 Tax=Curvibacter sp. APW13 TaxID=3077236 RepID=UPI0028DF992C|nr:deoxyribodipyrimidine photo-lyase [Curvibacter sp. APW13]MDT8989700.1 deoxyribodipyrimidine photo-lyase [Curvibacter sp. APW13]
MDYLFDVGLVWLRRDLRLQDNAALAAALQQCRQVHCLFVLDRDILDPLPRQDRRVAFILESLAALDSEWRALAGSDAHGLLVAHGNATELVATFAISTRARAVFHAEDYEPQARQRDAAVGRELQARGIAMVAVKDHVVFGPQEVRTRTGAPYTVFTPYLRAWVQALDARPPAWQPLDVDLRGRTLARPSGWAANIPRLQDIGFETPTPSAALQGGRPAALALLESFQDRMDAYDERRDYPALKGPSYLSVHLRFGTVSIRELLQAAQARIRTGSRGAEVWRSELAWRDFYFQILANFPHVVDRAFKAPYDAIVWDEGSEADALFDAWCEGRTGYPLVDAAMAQLNQTGYMHNRLRMVVGSFLVKNLGIDWRRGERYFAEKLNDFDLAANNGGWQWVASSGCDAQPYFRIFNPVRQSERFDPDGKFITRYLPQLAALGARHIHAPWLADADTLARADVSLGGNYPMPVVDHARSRAKTLLRYGVVGAKTSAE